MTRHRTIVLGVGRSGTGFVAEALRATGLTVGHETVHSFEPTSGTPVAWADYDADASLAAWCWADRWPTHDCTLVHVQRDPVQVVRSWLRGYFWADVCPCHPPGAHTEAPYRRFLTDHLPQLVLEPDEPSRALRYVLDATAMIEHACTASGLPTVRLHLDQVAGWAAAQGAPSALELTIDTDRNHKPTEPGREGWTDLLDLTRHRYWPELADLAHRIEEL